MWADHEFDEHRVNRSLVCPDCSAQLFSSDAWDEHLRQNHKISFEGSQHAIALDSARRIISKPIDEQECLMCKVIPGSTRRAFSTHVGRHMEQIALAVLPRETEDDLEESSMASDLPIHDQCGRSSLGEDLALPPNSRLGSLDKLQRSIFDDSETGHLVDTTPISRGAGEWNLYKQPIQQSTLHEGGSNLERSRASAIPSDNLFYELSAYGSTSSLDPFTQVRREELELYTPPIQQSTLDEGGSNLEQSRASAIPSGNLFTELPNGASTSSLDASRDAKPKFDWQCGDDLRTAAERGDESEVQTLLQVGANVNAKGDVWWTALQAASAEGHGKVVQMLLQAGADANAQGGHYRNALQAASAGGYRKVVETLLQVGADVNAQVGIYENALQAASARGQHAVVQLLLDKGADVNSRGGEYGTGIQAASAGGRHAVVQLLLGKGADVNSRGGEYGTAIQVASARGHTAVVQLLLNRVADPRALRSGYRNASRASSSKR